MRLVRFEKAGAPALGLEEGGKIADLSALSGASDFSCWGQVLKAGAVDQVVAGADEAAQVATKDLRLLPPIGETRFLCAGLNYRSHALEVGRPIPDYAIFFTRFASSLVGANDPLVKPKASDQYDYEAELAVIIGKGGRNISKAQALDHVFGYAAFNDGSLRDYQFRSEQWTPGKNFDRSGSFGPAIVTADALPAGGEGLKVICRLNGETVQDGNTDDLIFSVADLIVAASSFMTLEPGDVIPTGTPPGVGAARKPPLWMKPGDHCEVEVEGIGQLSNAIIAES